MRAPGESHHFARAISITCGLAGALLVAGAALADRRFFDRHVLLPYYFLRPASLPTVVRAVAAGLGVALAAGVGPALAGFVARHRLRPTAGGAARAAVALLAALLASEAILRVAKPPETRAWYPRWEFKVGAPHPRYGWAARPTTATTL